MTRLRTYNNRAKAKALSRRQINQRKGAEIRRRFRRHFKLIRNWGLQVTSSFRTLGEQAALTGRAFNSFHKQAEQSDLYAIMANTIKAKPDSVHDVTARQLGIDRKAAKELNYFALYGGGPDGKPFSDMMRKHQK